MTINYADRNILKTIADEIKAPENNKRKDESIAQFEVFMDRMKPYVDRYMLCFYNQDDIQNVPVISSINLARRIVKQEASIYKIAPERTFTGVSEDQAAVLTKIYKDMNADVMLDKSNEYFKLQGQNVIQVIPYGGKLKMRVFLMHQLDAVPDPMQPEVADAYILSGYNKLEALPESGSDGVNQSIADADDYKSNKQMVLWSKEFNFFMTQSGEPIGPTDINPINELPFIDVSPAKDFEFFIRQGSNVAEFTVQFNASLSDMSQVVRMQGFAQAYLIGPEGMMPESVKVGSSVLVKLPINPNQPEARPEFGFAQPNADLEGSMKFLESLLAMYLTTRGLDPKTISASGDGKQFTSGLERLLSMIEKFDATRSDFAIYERAEKDLFRIVKAYVNTYAGTDILNYKIAAIPDDADVEIKFHEPEMIETEADKLKEIQTKLDLGLISKVEAIMEDRGIPQDQAIIVMNKIKEDMAIEMPDQAIETPQGLEENQVGQT
jgi:hypothetical protein